MGQWQLAGRYRLKRRQKDNEDNTGLLYKTEHRGRLSAAYQNDRLQLKTQVDMVCSDFKKKSTGWMVAQYARYAFNKTINASLSIGYFHTDDYDSRIYSYERGMLYTFNFPVFYGKGIRYALMAGMDLGTNLTLTAKIGTTNYFNRSTISSSYQEIDGSSMTDVDVQLRCRF
jgi:hypothetical protein